MRDDLMSKMSQPLPDLRSKMKQPAPDLRAKLTGVKDLRARLGQRAVPASKGSSAASPKGKGIRGAPTHKLGDWDCPSCGSLVFASKATCFACGTPKDADVSAPAVAVSRYETFKRLHARTCQTEDEVIECIAALEPPLENAKEYTIAMRAFDKVRAWRSMLELIKVMRARGIERDGSLYRCERGRAATPAALWRAHISGAPHPERPLYCGAGVVCVSRRHEACVWFCVRAAQLCGARRRKGRGGRARVHATATRRGRGRRMRTRREGTARAPCARGRPDCRAATRCGGG